MPRQPDPGRDSYLTQQPWTELAPPRWVTLGEGRQKCLGMWPESTADLGNHFKCDFLLLLFLIILLYKEELPPSEHLTTGQGQC